MLAIALDSIAERVGITKEHIKAIIAEREKEENIAAGAIPAIVTVVLRTRMPESVRWDILEPGKSKLSAKDLDSLLNFKFPRYWIDKQKEYESISIAIMRIINENSNNQSLPESLWKIEQNLKEKDIESIKFYIDKIKEWISMGLIL